MRQREVAGHPNAKEFGHTRICTVAAGEESLALYHAGTGRVWRWTPGAEGSAWTPELDSVPAGPVEAVIAENFGFASFGGDFYLSLARGVWRRPAEVACPWVCVAEVDQRIVERVREEADSLQLVVTATEHGRATDTASAVQVTGCFGHAKSWIAIVTEQSSEISNAFLASAAEWLVSGGVGKEIGYTNTAWAGGSSSQVVSFGGFAAGRAAATGAGVATNAVSMLSRWGAHAAGKPAEEFCWEEQFCGGDLPTPRFGHTAALVGTSCLVIVGGVACDGAVEATGGRRDPPAARRSHLFESPPRKSTAASRQGARPSDIPKLPESGGFFARAPAEDGLVAGDGSFGSGRGVPSLPPPDTKRVLPLIDSFALDLQSLTWRRLYVPSHSPLAHAASWCLSSQLSVAVHLLAAFTLAGHTALPHIPPAPRRGSTRGHAAPDATGEGILCVVPSTGECRFFYSVAAPAAPGRVGSEGFPLLCREGVVRGSRVPVTLQAPGLGGSGGSPASQCRRRSSVWRRESGTGSVRRGSVAVASLDDVGCGDDAKASCAAVMRQMRDEDMTQLVSKLTSAPHTARRRKSEVQYQKLLAGGALKVVQDDQNATPHPPSGRGPRSRFGSRAVGILPPSQRKISQFTSR